MRSPIPRRRRGRPSGPARSDSLANKYGIGLARALRVADKFSKRPVKFSKSGAHRFSVAWLAGELVASIDLRGAAFIAAPNRNGLEGRAAGIARRKRRDDDQWLAGSVAELVVWLCCRTADGKPGGCTAAAMLALAKIDPGWPEILVKLENALHEIAVTKACGFELLRLPPAAFELVKALRRTG